MTMNVQIRTVKEGVRHLLHALGLRRKGAHLHPKDRRSRFHHIYQTGLWQVGAADQPLSGTGSSLAKTETLRRELPPLLAKIGAETILDLGCGDFTWMRTLDFPQKYIGVDIVPSVIEENKARWPAKEFHCLDGVVDKLPDADVVLCREVLFHLSFKDGLSMLKNVLSTDRRWFIATTDSATLINSDIETGDFRILNLRQPPYRFPNPDLTIDDSENLEGRVLGVWSTESLRAHWGST